MTMADEIAVMHDGRIQQLGTPNELYERPRTRFVAGFLGASNLLAGTCEGDGVVRCANGALLRVPAAAGRRGPIAIGVRPEKIRLGRGEENAVEGVVAERAYIGVSTQYLVSTPLGKISLYVQNAEPGAGAAQPGDQVTISWNPESTFVVEPEEEQK